MVFHLDNLPPVFRMFLAQELFMFFIIIFVYRQILRVPAVSRWTTTHGTLVQTLAQDYTVFYTVLGFFLVSIIYSTVQHEMIESDLLQVRQRVQIRS